MKPSGAGALIVAAQAWANGVGAISPANRCSSGQIAATFCWYSAPMPGVAEWYIAVALFQSPVCAYNSFRNCAA
jgi:hypothetical protein